MNLLTVTPNSMEREKMTGRLRLKGQVLLAIGKGAENAHQLALRSQKSYPAVKKYVEEADGIKQIDLAVLPSVLVSGQGLTVEEMMNLKIGDLFEYVADPD